MSNYWCNKRYIAGGSPVANLLTMTATTSIHPPVLDFSYPFGALTYWPMLLIAVLEKPQAGSVLLLIMIGGYLAYIVLPTSWILQ